MRTLLKTVVTLAREAVQEAEDARLIALRKNESAGLGNASGQREALNRAHP